MKKINLKILIIIAAIIAIPIVSIIIIRSGNSTNTNNIQKRCNAEDALRFKHEYEALNEILDDEGLPRHADIYIPENNRVVYISFNELMDFIDSGTGVFFFGRPACPSCRALFPTFLQVAEVMGIYIYYYDIEFDRSEHNENYVRILEALHDYLPVDDRSQTPGTDGFDENLKRVTVPHLFFIEEGQIINEIMMNSHPLLESEYFAGLYSMLLEMFRLLPQEIQAESCDDC